MHLEIRHLKLVKAVVEEGSVTKAGHRLHITQSALSHQLRDIEERLGVSLFQRHNKKMILTSAGNRLLESANLVLAELQRAEEEVRKAAEEKEGVVRITTECYTCYHWLPAMLKAFSEECPKVGVDIVVEATRQPIQALLEGKVDVAIVCHSVRNRRIVYKPFLRSECDELIVLVHPGHRLASRPYVAPEDFAAEQLFIYKIPRDEMIIFNQVLNPSGVTPLKISEVELTEAIIEMVRAGLGVSVMARWAVLPQLQSGDLRGVRLTKKGIFRQWNMAMLRSKATPAYLMKFVKLLGQCPKPEVKGFPLFAAGPEFVKKAKRVARS